MSKKNDNSLDNVDKLIENTFTRLRDIIDANTIIGKTIKCGENISIVPISKVSVGLVTGGGQMPVKRNDLSSIGSTTGFTLTPIGFLSISGSNISYIPTSLQDDSTGKLIDTFALIYDKLLKFGGDGDES